MSDSTAQGVFAALQVLGVRLQVEAGTLRFHPRELVSADLLELMRGAKDELIELVLSAEKNRQFLERGTSKSIRRSQQPPLDAFAGTPSQDLPVFRTDIDAEDRDKALPPVPAKICQSPREGPSKSNIGADLGISDASAVKLLEFIEATTGTGPLTTTCYCCGEGRFWRLNEKTPWVCERCHASGRPPAEVEWKHVAAATTSFATDPPVKSRSTLPAAIAKRRVKRG